MATKLDYLQAKKLSPADELREKLSSLEEIHLKLPSMDSGQALTLFRELDYVDESLAAFEANGLDLRSERVRFETIQGRLRKRVNPLLKAVGGRIVLSEHRPTPAPPSERWWWYVDEIVASQQQQSLRRIGTGVAIGLLIIGGVVLAFNTFLKPDPAAVARLEATSDAYSAVEVGDYQQALAVIEEGLLSFPDDPELLIFKGALRQVLGEEAQAAQSFVQAQEILNNPIEFHLARSQLYLRLNRPKLAEKDAQTILDTDENVARAWLFLGQALETQRRNSEATEAYETASQVALESGEDEVYVLSRLALGQLMQIPPALDETPTPSVESETTE